MPKKKPPQKSNFSSKKGRFWLFRLRIPPCLWYASKFVILAKKFKPVCSSSRQKMRCGKQRSFCDSQIVSGVRENRPFRDILFAILMEKKAFLRLTI